MHEIAVGFVLLVYSLDILALFYFGIHCYFMVYLYLKNGKRCETDPATYAQLVKKMRRWPKVTLQVPMYNEYYVAERVIDAVCRLDYPKEKLEIQVVDDSTDETSLLVKRKVEEYRKKGIQIYHLTRPHRQGHKAGALREALKKAKGEFIAIFDADFLPDTHFLRKTIPYFWEDPRIGMVQARWGHINADYSLLTKAQSIGIDGHFIIEQVARSGSRLWMNFNGTAGVWRKKCIYDAGNWQADTLTEDFDLSYRAELRGWEFRYLIDCVNPAELPATISAYRSQQFRWCKGSLQTAVKLIPAILKSKESLRVKVEAITHLLNYTVHPLMVLNILATLPLLLLYEKLEVVSLPLLFGTAFVLSLGGLGPIVMYIISQRKLHNNAAKRLLWLPMLTIIGTGIALSNTVAWLEAILGKKSIFVRTPKLRLESKKDRIEERKKYKSVKLNPIAFGEIFLGCYTMLTTILAYNNGKYWVIPFMSLYALGFFYIGFLSLYETWQEPLQQLIRHISLGKAKEET
ncbi:MAG: glycosyltransferase family 2 protein [Leptospiraceae bacterium]|nr:glycosyltransferase family 2 protein [Leptospiraceae bacterium]MDW8307666.1 glycosyltransferase family 2 protein [Leptospiraceae bacterium]